MLVKFIEGFRGPEQRMPLGARPLSADQIRLIRRWISEGALNDHAATPCHNLRLPACGIAPGHALRVSSKVSTSADLVLFIQDHKHRTLYSEEASVKQPPEQMDAGAPNQLLTWTVNYDASWPREVEVELRIRYMQGALRATLSAQDGNGSTFTTQTMASSLCSPD